MLKEYLHEELAFLNKRYQGYEDLLSQVMEVLVVKDYVHKEFEGALLKREREFPTALQLDGYAVAIPHGGSEHVLKDFISLVTLKKPIKMNRMDDPEESLDVNIVFVIGISNSESHLELLKELMAFIQDPRKIESLKSKKNI